MPATLSITALKPRITVNPSTGVFSVRKMEIKSVPPVVAPAARAIAIDAPLMMPPNTLIRRRSSVIV